MVSYDLPRSTVAIKLHLINEICIRPSLPGASLQTGNIRYDHLPQGNPKINITTRQKVYSMDGDINENEVKGIFFV